MVDWGLAKPLGRVEPGADSGERTLDARPRPAAVAETLPGSALGTPAYMSPEQAAGDLDRLGPRSDVYSLGATLYCLLTGKPPFEGDDVGAMLRAVQQGEFPPPRQLDPSIDQALEAVCLKAMALEPEDRYATPGRWPTTSSGGWPTSRSRPTPKHWTRADSRRWLRINTVTWTYAGPSPAWSRSPWPRRSAVVGQERRARGASAGKPRSARRPRPTSTWPSRPSTTT